MTCNEFKDFISEYIDGQLENSKCNEFVEHMHSCKRCREEYNKICEIVEKCRDIPEVELPEGYEKQLHQKLLEQTQDEKRKKAGILHFDWKRLVSIAAILAILVVSYNLIKAGFYMGSSDKKTAVEQMMDGGANYEQVAESESSEDDMAYDTAGVQDKAESQEVSPEEEQDAGEQTKEDADTLFRGIEGRKIINNAYIEMETVEFDSIIRKITQMVEIQGGYVKNSNISGFSKDVSRSAHIELKVPQGKFGQFIEVIKGYGEIIELSESGEDITSQYFDTEARLKTLEIQEERLLALLEKAEKLDTILKLENELSRIRLEIENLTGTLKKWDHLVEYSTISINIYEVKKEEIEKIDQNLWQRMANSFIKSLNSLVKGIEALIIFIGAVLPYIPLILLAIWLFKKYVIRR
ncbi:MAG: DUF4349 domain-containing protein [Clostridia bacterium]|nr:DUF4349 domain-containing protein [Clostridia bacterium]